MSIDGKGNYPEDYEAITGTQPAADAQELARRTAELEAENAEMIRIAGEALGTHPDLRSSACVQVLADWVKRLTER